MRILSDRCKVNNCKYFFRQIREIRKVRENKRETADPPECATRKINVSFVASTTTVLMRYVDNKSSKFLIL